MIANMIEFSETLRKNRIIVAYNGPLWSDVIEGLAVTLQKRLTFDELPLSASQAVFSVFIEQMNNMLMYSAEKEIFEKAGEGSVEASVGTSILGVADGKYFIQTGNVISPQNMKLIKSRIDHLNTLDKSQLRKYYIEQMKSANSNPESKGAGIGLIEVARRTSSKIEYDNQPFGNELMFFTMYVTIGGGN